MKLSTTFSIKWQLLGICIVFVVAPVLTLGLLSYKSIKETTYSSIEQTLRQNSLDKQRVAKAYVNRVIMVTDRENQLIRESVATISLDVKKMLEFTVEHYGVEPPPEIIESLYNQIASIKVGKTGYVYLIDKNGHYIVSKDRLRDGENIWEAQDSDGRFFIQEMVNEGRKLKGDEIYPIDYPWINIGEAEARMKLAGIAYFEPWDIIIGASSYYEDFKSTDLKAALQEELKNRFADEIIGKTGYIWVTDSAGIYIVSKDRERDGENIWESKDANGVYFIQEMVKAAKQLPEGQAYIHYYPWQNVGEKNSRMKLAAVTYVPEWDWIIGPSAYQDDFLDNLNMIRSNIIIIVLISIVLGAIIAYLLALYITNPIKQLEKASTKVAGGDLNVTGDKYFKGTGEIKSLSNSFSGMIANFQQLIARIKGNVSSTASSAEKLSASAEEVNAAMQQISSTIQQIAASAQNTSKVINESKTLSAKTQESAKKGGEATKLVNNKMQEISSTIKISSENIKTLGDKSSEISKIVETINSITDQTNLLALNASIEAARAGEAGRGFAVVADEVRKLAEESAEATGQISELTNNIQNDIKLSVENMEKTSNQVNEGVSTIEKALKSMEAIPELANSINRSLIEIAAVAEQNAAGSGEASSAIQQITSSMQQVSSTAQILNKEAENLKSIVANFKLDEAEIKEKKNIKT